MAKYVPPSRRAGYVPTSSSSDLPPPAPRPWQSRGGYNSRSDRFSGETLYNAKDPIDIARHFNHPKQSTLSFFGYRPAEPLPQQPLPYDPTRSPKDTPLPPSPLPLPPRHPLDDIVTYISVFPNAHPNWNSRRELWLHSNADLMINDWKGKKRNFGRPVPLFAPAHGGNRISYGGWWMIDNLQEVEPHSSELKELLQTKERARSYSRGRRSADAWQMSMSERWIKIHLTPIPPGGQFGELRNVMELKGGEDGEVEEYLLKVGKLDEELGILRSCRMQRKQEGARDMSGGTGDLQLSC